VTTTRRYGAVNLTRVRRRHYGDAGHAEVERTRETPRDVPLPTHNPAIAANSASWPPERTFSQSIPWHRRSSPTRGRMPAWPTSSTTEVASSGSASGSAPDAPAAGGATPDHPQPGARQDPTEWGLTIVKAALLGQRAWAMTRRTGMRTEPEGPGRSSLPPMTASLHGRARAPQGGAGHRVRPPERTARQAKRSNDAAMLHWQQQYARQTVSCQRSVEMIATARSIGPQCSYDDSR
jgi:hypothetical protein